MNEMYFKEIIIADVILKKGTHQIFNKGLNVITSHENHVGKSALLKSLYYSLGAEVKFDNTWNKNSKLFITTIMVNDAEYRFARYQKNFIVFKDKELELMTNHVSTELAKKMEEIFDFAIYLPSKNNSKVSIAPPALTFLPYYIDQDTGWSELYNSFLQLNQYKKNERIKSLYYHLQIYTKDIIENLTKRDNIKSQIEELKKEEEKISETIQYLSNEMQSIIPANDIKELENGMEISKKKIKQLINEIGSIRNEIQELESLLIQNENQISIINKYRNNKTHQDEEDFICPNCGYSFKQELYNTVRTIYTINNEDYMLQQLNYVTNTLNEKLENKEQEYLKLIEQLKSIEKVYDEKENAYDTFLKQKGLEEVYKKLNIDLNNNISSQNEKKNLLKEINKTLNKLPNKKEIESTYIDFAQSNMKSLGAWNSSYEGNIKLLKPVSAQGSLSSKIILAQVIAFFQTMDFHKSGSIRFPLVIDSPRGNEASIDSSIEILHMIKKIENLPQIILSTIDYKDYDKEGDENINIKELYNKYSLLDENTYKKYQKVIEDVFDLIKKGFDYS